MNLIILPQDQIDRIVEVSDFILKHSNTTVGAIRKKFDLTIDEYNMIFDLCMPRIRAGSAAAYYKNKFGMLSSRVEDIVKELPEGEVKDKLIAALIESSIGENNTLAKEDSKEI
jgi:hypothetical protein